MSEIYQLDQSVHEDTVAHQHPLETIPQGSQADGAEGTHEHRDVSFAALGKWFTGLFVGIFFSFVITIVYFRAVVNWSKSTDEVPSATFKQRASVERAWPDPVAESPLQGPNEMPMILPDPQAPMEKLRKYEDQQLSTYSWAKGDNGKKNGNVTMPIDRAIELTAQRGLPSSNLSPIRPKPAQAEVVRPGPER
jgi:hypothetical protein